MQRLWVALHTTVGDEDGVSIAGYALMAAVIAVVAMGVAVFLGDLLSDHLQS